MNELSDMDLDSVLKLVDTAIERLVKGDYVSLLNDNSEDLPENLRQIAGGLGAIAGMLQELRDYAVALSKGNLDTLPPGPKNRFAAGLKNLHANLNHLTWQAKKVSMGDYEQVVDYMGEFSDAFNSMTRMLKEREERNLEKQRSLMRLFNKLNIIIAVLNGEDKSILFINEMAERFIMEIGGPDADNETRVGLFTSLLIENLPASNGTSVFFENNLNRWYQIESTDIEWQDGNPAVLCSISDVSMMKIKEESLRAIAEIDSLTGLYRRDAGITKFFSVMAEIREKNYIVLFIDIDNFKEINDKYGHQSGDKALVSISGALKRSLRDTDVIIRWGGDEFVCILTGSGQSSADVVITRINAKLDGVNKGARLPYRLLLSIGISSPSEDADEIFSRIEEADHKMYLAKNEKKTSLEI